MPPAEHFLLTEDYEQVINLSLPSLPVSFTGYLRSSASSGPSTVNLVNAEIIAPEVPGPEIEIQVVDQGLAGELLQAE